MRTYYMLSFWGRYDQDIEFKNSLQIVAGMGIHA